MCVLVALLSVAYQLRGEIAVAVLRRGAPGRIARDSAAALEDGLHVAICGAGSPMYDDRRSAPCTLVVAGHHHLVFDAGGGAARRLAQMGFALGRLERVFLTHFHSDHMWVRHC